MVGVEKGRRCGLGGLTLGFESVCGGKYDFGNQFVSVVCDWKCDLDPGLRRCMLL